MSNEGILSVLKGYQKTEGHAAHTPRMRWRCGSACAVCAITKISQYSIFNRHLFRLREFAKRMGQRAESKEHRE
jgi:hypothetical protein